MPKAKAKAKAGANKSKKPAPKKKAAAKKAKAKPVVADPPAEEEAAPKVEDASLSMSDAAADA